MFAEPDRQPRGGPRENRRSRTRGCTACRSGFVGLSRHWQAHADPGTMLATVVSQSNQSPRSLRWTRRPTRPRPAPGRHRPTAWQARRRQARRSARGRDGYRATTCAWDSGDAQLTPSALQEDPTAIGRYRVIRRLGQGGFGRVYLARDDELDRPVAVKVPKPERIAGPEDALAYLAEARTLAKLDHPHIVPVYDVGRTQDGLCYVVSKYVEGSDLRERMRHRATGVPGDRRELRAATVSLALHHAHTRGLVHRDVKPANILIDTAGRPAERRRLRVGRSRTRTTGRESAPPARPRT